MSKYADLAPVFTTSELQRIAAYLQLAQVEVLTAAKQAEHRRAADALIRRLDASASDIADLRARLLLIT